MSTLLRKLRKAPKPEFNVLILGLNNAGKSTLAARLGLETDDVVRGN